MKVEVAVLGPNKPTASVDVKQHSTNQRLQVRAQELRESRGGRPGLPVPNKPICFCGCKATLKREKRPPPPPPTKKTKTKNWWSLSRTSSRRQHRRRDGETRAYTAFFPLPALAVCTAQPRAFTVRVYPGLSQQQWQPCAWNSGRGAAQNTFLSCHLPQAALRTSCSTLLNRRRRRRLI